MKILLLLKEDKFDEPQKSKPTIYSLNVEHQKYIEIVGHLRRIVHSMCMKYGIIRTTSASGVPEFENNFFTVFGDKYLIPNSSSRLVDRIKSQMAVIEKQYRHNEQTHKIIMAELDKLMTTLTNQGVSGDLNEADIPVTLSFGNDIVDNPYFHPDAKKIYAGDIYNCPYPQPYYMRRITHINSTLELLHIPIIDKICMTNKLMVCYNPPQNVVIWIIDANNYFFVSNNTTTMNIDDFLELSRLGRLEFFSALKPKG